MSNPDLPPLLPLPEGVHPLHDVRRVVRMWEGPMHRDPAVERLLARPDVVFWQVGHEEGLYALYDVQPGLTGNVSINLWSPRIMGRDSIPKHREMLKYMFNAFDLKRIGATVAIGNKLSIKLAGRVGFVQEGLARNWGFYKGELTDWFTYSLLPDEVA